MTYSDMCLTYLGVPVVQVQENGIFSGTSYLGRTVKLESPLEEFSICARISLNYLRGRNSYWLSVANEDSNDLIVGGEQIHPVAIRIRIQFKWD